jgi:hypothetical protein
MESQYEINEAEHVSPRFEAQQAIASEYRELFASISKSQVIERGYDH